MNLHFATRALGAARLALQANAPTLMVVGGVVSMGAAVVTASKKTLDLEEILAPAVQALDTIEQATGHTGYIGGEFTEQNARTARYKVYSRATLDCTKHYAVPGVLFFGGAALVFGGHRIMLKRNAAITLAFTTMKKALDTYRANVIKAAGPEFDRAMTMGYKNREIVDEATGKTEMVSDFDWDADLNDPYARIFEQGESSQWVPDLGINKDFLEIQQQYAQQLLNRQGHLYLSDVYKALGMAESPLSRLVGWKVERLPDGSKNIPMVDFGLNTPMADDWTYSKDNAVYLDFNCQGFIIGGKVQKIMEKA